MAESFADHRGLIEDILAGPIDCVTRIFTREGKVRGNHIHHATTQWTYVVEGSLLVVSRMADGRILHGRHGPGEMCVEKPGEAHAWKALTDTTVLVFTRGPRSGAGYESDTERLTKPLL